MSGSNADKKWDGEAELPRELALELFDQENAWISAALANPIRRTLLRALHQCKPPACLKDLLAEGIFLPSLPRQRFIYHARVLQRDDVISQVGELTTPYGQEPLFVSEVSENHLVLNVLKALAAHDAEALNPSSET